MQLGVISTNLNAHYKKKNPILKSIPLKPNCSRNFMIHTKTILSEIEKQHVLVLLSYLAEIKMIILHHELHNKYYH